MGVGSGLEFPCTAFAAFAENGSRQRARSWLVGIGSFASGFCDALCEAAFEASEQKQRNSDKRFTIREL